MPNVVRMTMRSSILRRGRRREGRFSGETEALNATFLKWEHHEADSDRPSNALEMILSGEIDGVTLAGELPKDIVGSALSHLAVIDNIGRPTPHGKITPTPLLAVEDDHTPYLDDAEQAEDRNLEFFGQDVFAVVTERLSRLAAGRQVSVPDLHGRPYSPGTIRTLEPGRGGLQPHTGNLFVELNQTKGLRHLDADLHLLNSLSWFVVLQAPEQGGSLRLFDLRWPNTPGNATFGVDWFDQDSGLASMPSATVRPIVGDLQVFRGGDIWHCVDNIGGSDARVTLGGFMAATKDGSGYRYWS